MKRSKKIKAGKLSGPSHKKGGILLEAEGGEYIIKKSSVKKIGKKTLDKINKEGKLPKEKKMARKNMRGETRRRMDELADERIAKTWKTRKKPSHPKKGKDTGPKMFGKSLSELEEGIKKGAKKGVGKIKEQIKKHKAKKRKKKIADLMGDKVPSPKKKNLDKSPKSLTKGHRTFKGGRETTMDRYYKKGGKVGDSIKTYSQGGYVEGK
tara:strand:+ start:1105 stop:1731 length:627 start_codon:yes stop_codon:yes gene_type:complete